MVILQTEVKMKINMPSKGNNKKIKFDIQTFFLLTKYFMYVVHVIEFSNICALTLLPWLSKFYFFLFLFMALQ